MLRIMKCACECLPVMADKLKPSRRDASHGTTTASCRGRGRTTRGFAAFGVSFFNAHTVHLKHVGFADDEIGEVGKGRAFAAPVLQKHAIV